MHSTFEDFEIPQYEDIDKNRDLEEQGRRMDLRIQDILDRLEILERLIKE